MYKNTIQTIPFTGEQEKWLMWLGKLMAIAFLKGYHVLLTGAKTITDDDEDKTK